MPQQRPAGLPHPGMPPLPYPSQANNGQQGSGQPGYAPSVHAQPGYSQPNYTQPNYTQPNYTQPNYTQPTYTQPTYTQPTYTQPTYTQPGYGPAGYPPTGYGPGGYPSLGQSAKPSASKKKRSSDGSRLWETLLFIGAALRAIGGAAKVVLWYIWYPFGWIINEFGLEERGVDGWVNWTIFRFVCVGIMALVIFAWKGCHPSRIPGEGKTHEIAPFDPTRQAAGATPVGPVSVPPAPNGQGPTAILWPTNEPQAAVQVLRHFSSDG